MSYQRICIAVALQRYLRPTPVALRQRRLARLLARDDGATIFVVTVEAPVPLVPHLRTTEVKLAEYVEPLRQDDLPVESALLEGRPSQQIREYIGEIEADLLILGSHSKRGVLDVGIGSTAKALGREKDIPSIMVRPSVEESAAAQELMIPNYPFIFPYA